MEFWMFLKVGSTVFSEGWNVKCGRKREVKDDASVLGPDKSKDSISITYNRLRLRISLVFSNKEVHVVVASDLRAVGGERLQYK